MNKSHACFLYNTTLDAVKLRTVLSPAGSHPWEGSLFWVLSPYICPPPFGYVQEIVLPKRKRTVPGNSPRTVMTNDKKAAGNFPPPFNNVIQLLDGAVQIVLQLLIILFPVQIEQHSRNSRDHSRQSSDHADEQSQFASSFHIGTPPRI